MNFLVGNVLIVDTLQTGIALVRERGLRDTIVTLTGEQITGGGAITGGRFQRERSILSRRVQARGCAKRWSKCAPSCDRVEVALHAAHRRAETAIAGSRRARAKRLARVEAAARRGARRNRRQLGGDVERMHGRTRRGARAR